MKEQLTEAFRLFYEERFDEAEQLYRACLSEAEEGSQDAKTALHGLGFTLSMKGEYIEAFACYENLLLSAIKEQNHLSEAVALHQIGMVCRMNNDYALAKDYFQREKNVREQSLLDDHIGFSANAYEFGLIALHENRLEESLQYFNESIEQGNLAKDHMCIACAYRGKGQYYEAAENKDEAKESFQKSVHHFLEAGDEKGAAEVQEMIRSLNE